MRAALIARVENGLLQRLAERGIYLHYTGRSWSPGQGLRLENVVIRRDATGDRPVVEVSALTVGVPLTEIFQSRSLISHWRTRDARLVLHDEAGALTFEHVSTQIILRAGQLETPRLDFQTGALTFALSGKILLPPGAEKSDRPPGDFVLDLSTVRDVLGTLDFKTGHSIFAIHGSYAVDVRGNDAAWRANLTGTGEGVTWRGVPLRQATATGQLSSRAGMRLDTRWKLTAGSAEVTLSRKDWESAPLLLAGKFTDASGQSDEFSASYEDASQTLKMDSLSGRAHLLEFARNFPGMMPDVSATVQIQKFPDIAVRNFSYSFLPASTPTWQAESIVTRSPADFTYALEGGPIKVTGAEGSAAFSPNTWKVQLKSGPLVWRKMTAQKSELEAALTDPQLKAKIFLQLPAGATALTFTSADWKNTPLQYSGTLTDGHGQTDRLQGSYQRDSTTLRISQLSGRANLVEYAANFPGLTPTFPRDWRVRTFPELAVKDFTYRAGKKPTVASLRVISPADLTAMIEGRTVTLDDVTGEVSTDGGAWQFSGVKGRTLDGRWTLDGKLDNGTLRGARISGTQLHLAQLKPWMGAGGAPGSLGDAILTFDYRGDLSDNFARFSGSGSFRLENAPVVKVPLLDQTYALFSVLASPVERRGTGRLDATYSATNGLVTFSQFAATSDAMKVTATGTLDLRQRRVSGRARGNLRGFVGLATKPLSHTLEMQVSGPLDNIRVRPLGLGGVLTGLATGTTGILPGTAKHASSLVRDGVALPLRAFDLFKPETPEAKR